MAYEVREFRHGDKQGLSDFIWVAKNIYASDPRWVRPLDRDVMDRLDRKKNPFFEHAEATAFLAYREGMCVGRITAQIDHEHLKRHGDQAAFFGFFDTESEPELARLLLDEAARWARARGMKRLRGPFSLSINDEIGCLVEGFDTPPMVRMPHHHPYQAGLIEAAGFRKAKDVLAWRYDIGDVPSRALRAHDEIAALPEVTARPMNPRRMFQELRTVMDVFNDAWSDSWGFVPLTEGELVKMARDLGAILVPEITRIVSIDGEPAAVALALPNLNDLIRDLHGRLFPLGWPALLWRLRVRGPRSGRLLLLGIRKKWRNVRRYAGLSAYLCAQMNRAAHLLGMDRTELSWTLEDDGPINAAIKLMGGKPYKRYRVFERDLMA